MTLSPDKIAHLKAGGLTAAAAAVFIAIGHAAGLHGNTIALALAGLAAGAAVEYAQRGSNARVPGLHDVSFADFAASAAPALLLAAAWEIAVRAGVV